MNIRYLAFGLYYHEIPSWQFIGNLSNRYQIDRIITFIIKNMVNDYHLKSCIFVEADVLWTLGRKPHSDELN
jgi:hypothetical protein